jgi:hypothetical protein
MPHLPRETLEQMLLAGQEEIKRLQQENLELQEALDWQDEQISLMVLEELVLSQYLPEDALIAIQSLDLH